MKPGDRLIDAWRNRPLPEWVHKVAQQGGFGIPSVDIQRLAQRALALEAQLEAAERVAHYVEWEVNNGLDVPREVQDALAAYRETQK